LYIRINISANEIIYEAAIGKDKLLAAWKENGKWIEKNREWGKGAYKNSSEPGLQKPERKRQTRRGKWIKKNSMV
jgi:hypothetical protein